MFARTFCNLTLIFKQNWVVIFSVTKLRSKVCNKMVSFLRKFMLEKYWFFDTEFVNIIKTFIPLFILILLMLIYFRASSCILDQRWYLKRKGLQSLKDRKFFSLLLKTLRHDHMIITFDLTGNDVYKFLSWHKNT